MSNHPILQWARRLAREIGAEAVLEGDEIRLQPASPKWQQVIGAQDSLVLSPHPGNMQAWRTRIQYVEKMAAQALLAGPMGYACTLVEPNQGESVDILRLAFGFSLSAGSSCRQRYTAYYVFNKDVNFYQKGNDSLFECEIQFDSLDPNNKNLEAGLQNLFRLIPIMETEYKCDPAVQNQLNTLSGDFLVELRDLERFYSPSYSQYISILGNPPHGLRGIDTVEVEYSNRMEDIIDKYRVKVLFEPLSAGIIHCNARLSAQGEVLEISLPFIDRSLTAAPSQKL